MKNILTIFKKEIKRFFTDPRMLIALFLPGVLIFLIYTIIGNVISNNVIEEKYENVTYNISYSDNYGSANDPKLLTFFENYIKTEEKEKTNTVAKTSFTYTKESLDEQKQLLKENKTNLVIVFTANFESNLENPHEGDINNITMYFNGADKISSHAYQMMSSFISFTYNNYTQNIENGVPVNPNISTDDYTMKKVMSFILPMVTVSMLFGTIISIVPESVAGEKERGTLASILITPIKRTHLALGKILALSLTAIASGLTSFLGLILSLPKLIGGTLTFDGATIVSLFFLIITALLFFVTFGMFVSSFAKSIKEASSYLGPSTMFLMVFSIIPAIVDTTAIGYSFVPVLNLCSSINMLILGQIDIVYLAITIVINIICCFIFIFGVAKLFNNEKTMFNA